MTTQELCKKYFGTTDLYKLLATKKSAQEKDIKKAYYKLSLQVHPDRVAEEEKENATEKFKLLSKVYQILTDDDKRKLYDEQGIIAEDDDFWGSSMADMLNLWRTIFEPLTIKDIDDYKAKYVGSELELKDIKTAYNASKGCINKMMNIVPFLGVEDEPRLQEIVGEMIKNGDVPEYKLFTNEPESKRAARHRKAEREQKEADKHKKKMEAESGKLEKQLLERRQQRNQQFSSMLQNIISKYGEDGTDDDDSVELQDLGKKLKKKQKPTKKKDTPKKASPSKKLHNVKNGRVEKKNKN